MTQKELDFIQEACYEKVQRLLNGIVADQGELQNLRVYKQSQEKTQEKAQEKAEKAKK